MDLKEFVELHAPALGLDEVRFNLQLAVLASVLKDSPPGFRHWSLGAAGHCAFQWPGRAIVLGDLSKGECEDLARQVAEIDYPGVVGSDDMPHWFVGQAVAIGAQFDRPVPQSIQVIRTAPQYPGAPGEAREIGEADAPLLFAWLSAFHQEAVPHDPPPVRANAGKVAASGRFLFWTVEGQPVSMAAVTRRLRDTGAIAPVYTPLEHRGHGYAGSVTAAVVDKLFTEGKTTVCLYTDLRNPMSNRCYARVGFTRHCDSWHYLRKSATGP
jgi:RimJ/RimL family protein N-acetyltransferase